MNEIAQTQRTMYMLKLMTALYFKLHTVLCAFVTFNKKRFID